MSEHQTIVVTGGSTGIGAAICQQFLDQGMAVVNLARRPLEVSHPLLTNVEIDLSDRQATQRVANEVAAGHEVTGFIHNAGLIRADLIESVKLDDFDYLSQVHVGAAITLSQAFIPTMKARLFGRIILITSRAALGLQTRTSYTATKAGMIGMARTWALELGDTEMFTSVIPSGSEKIDAMAASIPVKRLGKSDDVANAVSFLAGDGAGFITGQTLMVCGGASLGSLAL